MRKYALRIHFTTIDYPFKKREKKKTITEQNHTKLPSGVFLYSGNKGLHPNRQGKNKIIRDDILEVEM